jgi:hypothetical protein
MVDKGDGDELVLELDGPGRPDVVHLFAEGLGKVLVHNVVYVKRNDVLKLKRALIVINCLFLNNEFESPFRLRGRLHVSDSAHDFMHNLHTKGLGFQLSLRHQLQPLVNTFQDKSVEN